MRTYILSVVLGFSLVACGGGGDSSETNINRIPIPEISKVENLNSHLIISDYILNDGTALEKSGIKVTLDGSNLRLFDGDKCIASGNIHESMNSANYSVGFGFYPDLPENFFKEDAAKNFGAVNVAYTGHADYDPESHTFKMTVKKELIRSEFYDPYAL